MATQQTTQQPKKLSGWVIFLGIVVIIILATIPLIIVQDSEFGGSDNLGAKTVETIAPEYDTAWITNWWTPGRETESALFALQAAIGGILIGYGFGYLRGRKKTEEKFTQQQSGEETKK